jgi:glycopeptide antibiotics resistance protein
MNNRMMNKKNFFIILLFIVYVCIFIYSVFLVHSEKGISSENIYKLFNFIPFKKTYTDFIYIIENGPFARSNLAKNIFGNILLFMPLPFFLRMIFNIHKMAHVLLIGLLLSLWVETMQYIFVLGVSDIDDVLLNVLGVYVGFLLIYSVQLHD